MNNAYFRAAVNQASSILGSRRRLVLLTVHLFTKLSDAHLKKESWRDRIFLVGRLLKAFAAGRYREVPFKSIILLIAAVIYFINPLDLIPDAVIGLGLTDDVAILTGVYNLVSAEIEKFQKWEAVTSPK